MTTESYLPVPDQEQATYENTAEARRVILVDTSGNIVNPDSVQLTEVFENNSNGQAIYIGQALPGTATSSSTWRIKKIEYSGYSAISIKWADGTASFTKKWDDRASYTYS